MRKSGLFFVFVLLALALSACTRSASTTPQLPLATPTLVAPLGDGTAVPTEDPMSMLQTFATQTAMAESGTQQPVDQTPGVDVTPSPEITGNPPSLITVTPGGPQLPTVTPGIPLPNPTAIIGRPQTYTLQQGEFPYCIARRFNLNPDELYSLNGIIEGVLYQPGFVLKIPQTGNPFPGNRALLPHPTSYTVGLSQTIYSIACKYGDVDPMSIASANGLSAPYTLQVGQSLSIP